MTERDDVLALICFCCRRLIVQLVDVDARAFADLGRVVTKNKQIKNLLETKSMS